jgi:hypothetical protein
MKAEKKKKEKKGLTRRRRDAEGRNRRGLSPDDTG